MPAPVMTKMLIIISQLLSNKIDIPDEQVPLAGVFDTGAWSVLNLIVVCLAFLTFVLLAVVMLYSSFKNKQAYKTDKTDTGSQRTESQQTDSILLFSQALPWMIGSAIITMLVIFLFAFSQDFKGNRIFYDRWSFILLGLYIMQIATTVRAMQKSLNSKQGLKWGEDPGVYESALISSSRSQDSTGSGKKRVTLYGTQGGQFKNDSHDSNP
ncbi:MAG: hypothetical protein FWH40_04990 [Coriobacteriia bacterium]|nr:hypothetical protein [Coriobacteriia bacterium]